MNGLLGLAFAAGMLAPANPCGFALLPAWISYTLGDAAPLPVRLARALRAAAALTIGFAGTLAGAGLAISVGARALIHLAPWLGLVTGLALLLLGAVMLTGRTVRLRLPTAAPAPAASTRGWRLAAFGVGYAVASLSCTVGVLLAVIAQAQATASYAGLVAVFAAYATGSGAVLLLVAVGTAAAGAALTRRLGVLARHATRITAAVLILTGAYLAWYWYPAVVHRTTTTGNHLGHVAAVASTWIAGHTSTIAVLAVATMIAVAVGQRLGATRRGGAASSSRKTDCCATQDGNAVTAPGVSESVTPQHHVPTSAEITSE
ncbi:cytochrome c biogenesis protein CcdA [Mycobacterium sp.]|uniref:cytochrome c biogenesis CcdA family protein n=1 Tax=Mycobacterium sp. TaxID=1785 RepID=UPI0031D4AC36